MKNNSSLQRVFLYFLLVVLIISPWQIALAQGPSDEIQARLAEGINSILADEKLQGAVYGVSVRSGTTGEILYAHNGGIRLTPASNQKLLIGAAALEFLGPDYTFETELYYDGTVRGKTLHGNLYLKGKGDPTLLEQDLQELAQQIHQLGIHTIHGQVFADDTWYDDVRLSVDLPWSDESYYYGAQISALTLSPDEDYDAGTIVIQIAPSAMVGLPAQVTPLSGTDYVTVHNLATTVDGNQPRQIRVERMHGSNDIVVSGSIPLGNNGMTSYVAVWEPTMYTLDIFQRALEAEGINLRNKQLERAEVPEDARLIASHSSIPLAEIMLPFMKLSNNTHAEMLTKELGKKVYDEGSWSKGLQVVEEYLEQIGVNISTLRMRDGSGISFINMIPTNEISHLLYAVQDQSWFSDFYHSLPVAGISERLVGGTLRNRFNDSAARGNLVAKTGSLTGTTALSGYVHTWDGEPFIFSIIFNNYTGSAPREIEDRIGNFLAEFVYDED